MKRLTGFVLCLLAIAPLGCRCAAEEASPIARIGDTDINGDEIRSALESVDPRDQAAMAKDPVLLNQNVRKLLVRRLVLQEAAAKKWDQQPEVAAQLEKVRQAAIVESYLLAASRPPEGFPSDTELQAVYDSNKAALLVPRQFRLAQIFIAAPKTADDAVLEKAHKKLDAVRKALKQRDADFAAIAKAQSDEPESGARGGDIGWMTENQIQAEIRSQVLALAKKGVSEPVRLNDGWHFMKCLDMKEPYTPPLEEIRAQLIEQVRSEKAQALRQAYLAKLLQDKPISINELALSKLLKKAEK